MKGRWAAASLVCALLLIATVVEVSGQRPPEPPAVVAAAPGARQTKNIQVLRQIPPEQINPSMHLISAQLGVGCTYCHIWEQWERDDKPMKQVARRMIVMMNELNRSAFGGRTAVTCFTCHQGQSKPTTEVRLPVPEPPHWEAPDPVPPVLPAVDEVLGRYVTALGGERALRAITSRVVTGRREIPTGPAGLISVPAEFETYQKAPNLAVSIYKTEKFTSGEGFDGKAAWLQTPTGAVNNLPEPDNGRAARRANLYEPLEMRQNYTRMAVTALETIGPREVYVVTGYRDDDNPESLYFDVKSGLLLRRKVYLATWAGPSPVQIDFDDYRDTNGGVKYPFIIRLSPTTQRNELGTNATIRVQRVRHNVVVDDAKFVRPPSRRPAAPPTAAPAARPTP